jgi:intron-binding protein aquarius
VLAIPKLNLQFLSQEDYLERNYWLYKLESAYDLRKDIEDAITRMAPSFDASGCFTHFEGWARMASEIRKFKVQHVHAPDIGRAQPKSVIAEVQYSVEKMALPIRKEWDMLKRHDVVFMISFYTTEREQSFLE